MPTETPICTAADGARWGCVPGQACGVRFEACVDAPMVCTSGGVEVAATPTATGGSVPTGTGTGTGAGPETTEEPSGARPGSMGDLFGIGVAVAAAVAVGLIV